MNQPHEAHILQLTHPDLPHNPDDISILFATEDKDSRIEELEGIVMRLSEENAVLKNSLFGHIKSVFY